MPAVGDRQDPPLDKTIALDDDEVEVEEDLSGTMAMGLDEARAAKHKPATPFPERSGEPLARSQPGIPGAPWSPDSDPVEPPDSAFEGTQRLRRVEPLHQTVALDPAEVHRNPKAAPPEVVPVATPEPEGVPDEVAAPEPEVVTPEARETPQWRQDPKEELDREPAGPVRPPRPVIAEQRVDLSGLYSRFKRR